MRKLIYLCVFFNENYLNLLRLFSLSLSFFGNKDENTDILILTMWPFFDKVKDIFQKINMPVSIYCLDLYTFFEAAYSRLYIFDYPYIDIYQKILYLDADILITNNVNNILDLTVDDKLYTLIEGKIGDEYHGVELFDFSKIDPETPAFTSGILLFNNCEIIKDMFKRIIVHIKKDCSEGKPIPSCLDQPYIVYYAITENIYNNELLIGKCINNPTEFNENTVNHFCGWPGHYESKYDKMMRFMNNIFHSGKESEEEINDIYNKIINKIYYWRHDSYTVNGEIKFLENNMLYTSFGNGTYKIYNNRTTLLRWNDIDHIIKFNESYTYFTSIRQYDYNVSSGIL
jgi:lipopolysaccharide biosynthesis glycosyltransferase